MLNKLNYYVCWMGLNDIDNETLWKYTSGVVFDSNVTDWYYGEPNGWNYENCIEITNGLNSQWNDIPDRQKWVQAAKFQCRWPMGALATRCK